MKNLFKQGLKRFAATTGPQRARGTRAAKVVSVASLKGGVGKTTTSVNLASALARFHQQRVLLIDLDPQGHVGLSIKGQLAPGGGLMSQVLTHDEPGHVMDVATDTGVQGLRVTPPDPALVDAENLMGAKIGKEMILRDALEVTRSYYDVILIDCPPNLGNLTVNALVASDYMLVPCDLSPLAVQGVESLLHHAQLVGGRLNPGLDLLGVVITRYDTRTPSLNESVLTQLERQYGDALLSVRVGVSTSLSRAQHAGFEIFEHDPRSRGAVHYRELGAEVARRLSIIN